MDTYAVIGHPVAHSQSPFIHREFAKQTQQDIEYIKIEAPLDGFVKTVNDFRDRGGKGFNVTLPFKKEAWQLVDTCSDRANIACAVNTVKINEDGTLYGDNTDGIGLVRDITINQNYSLTGRQICLLGAGGAAQGVLKPILDERPPLITVANRTKSKAVNLAEQFIFYGNIEGCGFDELSGKQFDLIMNGTSANLSHQSLNLPPNLLAADGWCYDMMYSEQLTLFLQWAKTQGASRVVDGFGMLIEQAAESFFIWRGVRPNTACLLAQNRVQSL